MLRVACNVPPQFQRLSLYRQILRNFLSFLSRNFMEDQITDKRIKVQNREVFRMKLRRCANRLGSKKGERRKAGRLTL